MSGIVGDARKRAAESIPSPPFRDSDAIYIIVKRLTALADKMTAHDYSAVEADLAEVAAWMDWLAEGIAKRADEDDDGGVTP